MLSKIKKWLNGDSGSTNYGEVIIPHPGVGLAVEGSFIEQADREWMDNQCKAYAASMELRRRVTARADAGEASKDVLEVLKAILYVVRMTELRMSTKPKPDGYDEWARARNDD